MVRSLKLRAYGKINLGLDVTGKREDGYHLVRMIMQSVGIYDRIELVPTREPGIRVENNLRFLPVGPKNLAYRAAEMLMTEAEVPHGLTIRIEKHIPVAGGMAGGSSDAAAVLFGVNRLFRLHLTREELLSRGLKLGADVPFCLLRGTALAEGIGEVLTPLPAMPACRIVIAKPQFSVSTKDVYHLLDGILPPGTAAGGERQKYLPERLPDIDGLIRAVEAGDYEAMLPCMGNILENVTVPRHPEIDEIRRILRDNGADLAMMSGSGPTVFGLFRDRKAAEHALKVLRQAENPASADGSGSRLAGQTYLTEPCHPAERREEYA